MAILQSLHLYPIKSCAGIALSEARLGHAGLESQGVGDREWMLVEAGSGEFVTQRSTPRMALIVPALAAGALAVRAPGQADLAVPLPLAGRQPERQVTVWGHACQAFDEGDAAAAWFSAFLGRALRLVRFDPAHRRASSAQWTGETEALNRFSDGFPILLISQASLDDLNARLAQAGRAALPMNRFRPNLVLGGVGPYEEDHLQALRADGLELRPVKPCPRCPVPSIEQSSGEFGPDPLDILAQYRADARTGGVVFGQNVIAVHGQGQTLRAGQVFEPEWNF